MWMRRTQPLRPRPFRLWLYPVPPLVALAGFAWILVGRKNFQQEIWMALAVLALGTIFFFVRQALVRRGETMLP
jgi:hypothetical protein